MTTEEPLTPTRAARQARGMSLRELERVTGIARGHLSTVERGGAPSREVARTIAAVLNISPALVMFPDLDVA